MNKKQIRHIVHSFYKKLKKRLTLISPGFDTEAIHQYRVQYKKLRAFLRLLSVQNKKGKVKIHKKLNNIYRCTGALRDLQLLEEKLSLLSFPTDRSLQIFMNIIRVEIKKIKKQFALTAKKKIITLASNKTVNDLPRNCTYTHFKKFAAQNWDEINGVISLHQFNDRQIHTVRKNLKDLSYNLKYFKRSTTSILSPGNWNTSSIRSIETLMVELGNFQDNVKAIDLLTRLNTAYGAAKSYQLWQKVLLAWQREKQHRRQIVVHLLKQAVV